MSNEPTTKNPMTVEDALRLAMLVQAKDDHPKLVAALGRLEPSRAYPGALMIDAGSCTVDGTAEGNIKASLALPRRTALYLIDALERIIDEDLAALGVEVKPAAKESKQ